MLYSDNELGVCYHYIPVNFAVCIVLFYTFENYYIFIVDNLVLFVLITYININKQFMIKEKAIEFFYKNKQGFI